MSKIEMQKIYKTRCGFNVRILAVDIKNGHYPVAAAIEEYSEYSEEDKTREIIESFTEDGFYYQDEQNHRYDLIEYNLTADLVIDQPLWVRSELGSAWITRHFAKFDDKGVWCFTHGSTSHTVQNRDYDVTAWKYWSVVKPE